MAELLEEAEEDLLAFYRFPEAHWSKLRSTNPLERVNREVGRRSDVVGIFPNHAAAIRLAGSLLIEQNDEWLVGRRYLSLESLALVLEDQGDEDREEVPRATSRLKETDGELHHFRRLDCRRAAPPLRRGILSGRCRRRTSRWLGSTLACLPHGGRLAWYGCFTESNLERGEL